jgi:hypothetical protein
LPKGEKFIAFIHQFLLPAILLRRELLCDLFFADVVEVVLHLQLLLRYTGELVELLLEGGFELGYFFSLLLVGAT